MAENYGSAQPYVDSIANIRETTKWLIAGLGAVLAVVLNGIQLNSLGFSQLDRSNPPLFGLDPLLLGALAAVIVIIIVALYLGVDVLVTQGVSLTQLKTDPALDKARRYINEGWKHLPSTSGDRLKDIAKRFEDLSKKGDQGTLTDDEEEELTNATERVQEAVYVASWREVLRRFERLRWAMLLLVPIVILGAVIIASTAQEDDDGKELDPPISIALPTTKENVVQLAAAKWTAACMTGTHLPVLIYKEYTPGIGLAATQDRPSCPQRRLVVMDRVRILKVM